MTRETKVGLLVGMGVILLIGIIVSDQLSHIQREDPADLTEFAGQSQQSIAPLGTARSELTEAADRGFDAADTRSRLLPSPEPARGPQPIEEAGDDSPAAPARQAQRNGSILEQITNYQAVRLTENPRSATPVDPSLIERTTQETVIPLTEDQVPAIALDQPRRPSPTPADARTRTHTVAEGDSLYRLAEQYLGDGNLWKQIAEANPGKVTADGQVRAGVSLTIPGSPTAESPAPAAPRRAQPEAPRTYTVRSGDSLYSIARSQLGDGGAWKRIYDANRDKLDNPDAVKAGITLRIPG